MKPLIFVLPLMLLSALHAVHGLEVAPGKVVWLDATFRPDWTFETLQAGVDRVAKEAGITVQRSDQVRGLERDRMLTIVARERVPMRQVLEWIEASSDVVITASVTSMVIITGSEARNRLRRWVSLNLTDYAQLLYTRDQWAQKLGFPNNDGERSAGGFSLFSGDGKEKEFISPEDTMEALNGFFSAGEGQHMRSENGRAFIFATEKEEQAIRAYLAEGFARETRMIQCRVTFGLLTAGTWAGGFVAQADGQALSQRLQSRSQLVTSGLQGQQVVSGNVQTKVGVTDAEVVNDRLDPVIGALSVGRGLRVSGWSGRPDYSLVYQVDWVDLVAENEAPIRGAGQPNQQSMTAEIVADKDVTVYAGAELGNEGELMQLQQPTIWSWQPRGDVQIPPGKVLVLGAKRTDDTAIIILEVLP